MRPALARERRNLEDAFMRGEWPGYAWWIPGCPVRVSFGGVGGNRLLVLTPEPASLEFRTAVTSNRRDVRLASFVAADELKSQTESLAQRAAQPSTGGNMSVYSSKNSSLRELPPTWSPRMMRARGVGPPVSGSAVEEKWGQILQLRAIAASTSGICALWACACCPPVRLGG